MTLPTGESSCPTDLPTLIEQVYGDAEPTGEPKLLAALAEAKEEMTKDEFGNESTKRQTPDR